MAGEWRPADPIWGDALGLRVSKYRRRCNLHAAYRRTISFAGFESATVANRGATGKAPGERHRLRQKGFTMTRITMATINTVGISLIIRQ